MTEESTIEYINKKVKLNLKKSLDKFNDYDAENENYIVEIKNRRKYYKEKLIEALKLYKNYRNAQNKNKTFLYVVTDEKGVYVYNVSKNIEMIINNKPIRTMQPMTTDFDRTRKILKYCYYLPESLSKII